MAFTLRQKIKKRSLKLLADLLIQSSDRNFIRIVDVGSKVFLKSQWLVKKAQMLKCGIVNKNPMVYCARAGVSRLSKSSKDKLIENLGLNAMIIGDEKRRAAEKKYGFGMPGMFVISPTSYCNLNCKGCYSGNYNKSQLSFEVVDRVLSEAEELGLYFVAITGGEPFAWPYLFDILEKHKDMYFLIFTNGTLITKEAANKLAQLGNAAPAVSIEGFEEETNDRRGFGMFSKIMEAFENLNAAGVVYGFSATPKIHNSEILSSDDFIDFQISSGCYFGWYFQYIPVGKGADYTLMSTPEQRNKLRLKMQEWRETKCIIIGDFWNDGPLVGGCLAGARPGGFFHINSEGGVEPCVFLQHSVDNIKEKSLVEAIHSPFFQAIQKAQPYCANKNLLTPCALIDNPEIWRGIVKKFNPKPSYKESADVISDEKLTEFLDQYSKGLKKITDSVWESDISKEYKHWKDR